MDLEGYGENAKAVNIVTSWDDGHPLDIRLAGMLERHRIPATFYVPIENSEGRGVMSPAQIEELSKKFEIGGHTYGHIRLPKLDREEAYHEISRGKEALEDIVGRGVNSFCYPGGEFNDDVVDMVRKAGFSSARTVRLLEKGKGDPLRLPTTAHVAEKGLTHITNYLLKSKGLPNMGMVFDVAMGAGFARGWPSVAEICLGHILRTGGTFHLWGHSWEIEQFGQWDALDAFLSKLSRLHGHDGVRFLTVSGLVAEGTQDGK